MYNLVHKSSPVFRKIAKLKTSLASSLQTLTECRFLLNIDWTRRTYQLKYEAQQAAFVNTFYGYATGPAVKECSECTLA